MSTNDVPGAKPENHDLLAMGCWAEHDDGSLIFVEGVEGGRVIYSIFDMAQDPPVEYRDAMTEHEFKRQYTWDPKAKTVKSLKWTWHDKTPFSWDRIMGEFPAGQRPSSAVATLTAAQQVAESLRLRAQQISDRPEFQGSAAQRSGRSIMERMRAAVGELRR